MSGVAAILSNKADRERIVADLQARIRDCWTEDRAPIFTQVEKLTEHLARLAREPLVATIKPLKWRHVDVEQFEARTILGHYEVCGHHWSFAPSMSRHGYGECGSLPEAKSAAEAHHQKLVEDLSKALEDSKAGLADAHKKDRP